MTRDGEAGLPAGPEPLHPQGTPTPEAIVPVAKTRIPTMDRLTALEAIIDRGLGTFVQVGEALAEIRDGRLYQPAYPTFDDYLKDRWGFTRQRAHQMIDAAKTVAALPASTVVDNEAQARELAPVVRELGPAKAAEIVEQARKATGGSLTAQAIRVQVVPVDQPERTIRILTADEARATAAGWELQRARTKRGESRPAFVARMTRAYIIAVTPAVNSRPELAEQYGPALQALEAILRPIDAHRAQLELGAAQRNLARVLERHPTHGEERDARDRLGRAEAAAGVQPSQDWAGTGWVARP